MTTTTTGPSGKWMHDLHHKNNPNASRVSKLPTKLSPAVARQLQKNRLFAALHSDQVNVIPAATPLPKVKSPPTGPKSMSSSKTLRPPAAPRRITPLVAPVGGAKPKGRASISIRGSAGPVIVIAQNFAPGTTAQDVQQALGGIGTILSCRTLQTHPSVQCEIIFEKREAADTCVEEYNHAVADGRCHVLDQWARSIVDKSFPGRTLQVFIKPYAPTAPPNPAPPVQPAQPIYIEDNSYLDPYQQRKEADRQRRDANQSFTDGRYGMKPPPLYSDALMQKGRGFGR